MVIETKRLILRPFLEGDAADVYEYLKEPAVNCFASMTLHSLDEAKAEMKKRLGETEYYFAITLKEGGKVIGEIDTYPEAGEPHADEDAERDTFSPCWMLNEAYQGKGYAFEAAQAFFDYLFSQKGARRIYAYTEDYNLASQHLCEKLGMRREGLFLEFISFVNNPDGTPRYENTVQYAILKKEWEQKQFGQVQDGKGRASMNGTEEIGCCGAYCKTCREYQKTCKGCKPGYLDGSRDLSRARCKMKKCCLTRGHITCGDCGEYESCEIIQSFLNHPGHKYGKYKQALEFIRTHDYAAFMKAAENWENAYGKYPE